MPKFTIWGKYSEVELDEIEADTEEEALEEFCTRIYVVNEDERQEELHNMAYDNLSPAKFEREYPDDPMEMDDYQRIIPYPVSDECECGSSYTRGPHAPGCPALRD